MEVLPASQPEYPQIQLHFLSSNPLFLLCLSVLDPIVKALTFGMAFPKPSTSHILSSCPVQQLDSHPSFGATSIIIIHS